MHIVYCPIDFRALIYFGKATEVPGPGSYEAISTKASGHYFASNYSDVRSPKFSFGLSRDEFNKRASIKGKATIS